MFELFSELFQMAVLLACAVVALFCAAKIRSRAWLLYGLFCSAFFLGDLWWVLYLAFYGETSEVSLIPYLSWYASWLFLIVFLLQFSEERESRYSSRVLWAVPVFCAGMCAYYMTFGAYFNNLITAGFMASIMWISLSRLIFLRGQKARHKIVYQVMLLQCLIEYGMWTASCLDADNPLRHLYEVFSLMETLCFVLFIPAIGKAVKR